MKKVYKINNIPSFSFNINIPTGLSSIINDVGKAEIFLFGSWVGWNNIYYKEERDYLESIEKFFAFLNYPTHYTSDDLDRLASFNNSPIAIKMFEQLSGWTFNFRDCIPNTDTFVIRGKDPSYTCYFELRPEYGFDSSFSSFRYIKRYRYVYFCDSGYGPKNETKYIKRMEGLDLIALMRLSFRSMIYNYKEQHSTEIRVFSGWHNYKEDLIEQCKRNGLL